MKTSLFAALVAILALQSAPAGAADRIGKGSDDKVAAMIAKTRAEAAPATTDADLREVLGDAKLVAKADEARTVAATNESADAEAVMAGAEAAEAAALSTRAGVAEARKAATGKTEETEAAFDAEKSDANTDAAAATEAAAQAAARAKLPETEIPVLANTEKKARSDESTIQRLILSAVVLLVLAAGAFAGIRRWSKKGDKGKSTTKIKVLTQHFIGPKKSVAIIQVAGESILVGVTDHSITMLKSLSLLDEEIPEETPRNFDQAMDDFEDDEPRDRGSRGTRDRHNEDFAMRGLSEIRDTVSKRLRGLKEI